MILNGKQVCLESESWGITPASSSPVLQDCCYCGKYSLNRAPWVSRPVAIAMQRRIILKESWNRSVIAAFLGSVAVFIWSAAKIVSIWWMAVLKCESSQSVDCFGAQFECLFLNFGPFVTCQPLLPVDASVQIFRCRFIDVDSSV